MGSLSPRLRFLLGIGLILGGLPLLVLGPVRGCEARRADEGMATTEGTVTRTWTSHPRTPDGRSDPEREPSYLVHVEYLDRYEGTVETDRRTHEGLRPGDPFPVRYDPDDPGRTAGSGSGPGPLTLFLFVGGTGLACLLGGAFLALSATRDHRSGA